jgi:hypothetical protein
MMLLLDGCVDGVRMEFLRGMYEAGPQEGVHSRERCDTF